MTILKRLGWLAGAALLGVAVFVVAGNKAGAQAEAGPQGPAPAWKLRALDGREVSSSEFAGKVVVLNFWATWCPPCRAEIPDFIAMQKKHGGAGLVFVGISLDEGGPDAVKAFVEKQGINYPIVMGSPGVVDAFGGIEGIPTTFIIDREGTIRHKVVGLEKPAVLEEWILSLLGAAKS